MSAKSASKRLRSLAMAGALLLPACAWADSTQLPGSDEMTLTPKMLAAADAAETSTPTAALAPGKEGSVGITPEYLDEVAAEKPNIHGFFESPFRTSYITPRGLVVEDQGLVWQPVGGLVLPIGDLGFLKNFAIIGGVWNSVNTNQGDPRVGAWDEMDVFVSLAGNIADNIALTFTYGAWNFPTSTLNKPNTEHNLDLKVAYDDSKMWGTSGFGIHPYVDIFYEVGGSSTVVLGHAGNTGYAEIGIVPTFTFKPVTDYPVTLTMPTYVSVGPKDYWGIGTESSSSGNFGVLSSGLQASIPLAFIPARYGYWHVDGGVTYFNLLNGALFDAGHLLSGNRERNLFQGTIAFGVNF